MKGVMFLNFCVAYCQFVGVRNRTASVVGRAKYKLFQIFFSNLHSDKSARWPVHTNKQAHNASKSRYAVTLLTLVDKMMLVESMDDAC